MNIRKGYSAEEAPLVPALKLSTNLTVLCSRGTVVPPDYKRMKKIIKIRNSLNRCIKK